MTPQLNAIGLVVADIKTAIAFYERLGLQFADDDSDHVECELAGGVRLMLDTHDTARSIFPDWTPPSGTARVSLAFQVDSPAEVDAKFAELVEAGHQGVREPWDAFWGQRYAILHDPDGNLVDLYAAL